MTDNNFVLNYQTMYSLFQLGFLTNLRLISLSRLSGDVASHFLPGQTFSAKLKSNSQNDENM